MGARRSSKTTTGAKAQVAAKKKKRTSIKKARGTASKSSKKTKTKAKKERVSENAESMAKRQREISVSEFFAKNRHLLGFDNPRKALLTAVKEAVDNSLDACEEAGILPRIELSLSRLSKKKLEDISEEEEAAQLKKKKKKGPVPTERFLMTVIDNGPGIVSAQLPKIFGKLLYGSKFHRLKMSRGQQGIGISAAGMYGQMTTGVPVKITSKLPNKSEASYVELVIDTKTNKPKVITEKSIKWKQKTSSGTIVEITMEGRYLKGKTSVDEFIYQNTLSNPHAEFVFIDPNGDRFESPRSSKEVPELPKEIKPHPYGVELGQFHRLFSETDAKSLKKFLTKDFSRVSDKIVGEIFKLAGIKRDVSRAQVSQDQLNKVHEAIPQIDIKAPPGDCIVPIGEELIEKTLKDRTNAEFFTSTTRSPSVYRGNPFIVECALAFGGDMSSDDQVQIYRFANRVPLLFQPSACATTRVMTKIDWKKYGLQQSRGALPVGPVAVLVHVASVWVPFTSESKEAIADYPEITNEIRLALQDCARKLSIHLSKRRRAAEAERKANYIDTYIPFIGEALQSMLKLEDKKREKVVVQLRDTLEKSKIKA